MSKKENKKKHAAKKQKYSEEEISNKVEEIRQRSFYDENNKARPDNNMFFEKYSNPLSSKGN